MMPASREVRQVQRLSISTGPLMTRPARYDDVPSCTTPLSRGGVQLDEMTLPPASKERAFLTASQPAAFMKKPSDNSVKLIRLIVSNTARAWQPHSPAGWAAVESKNPKGVLHMSPATVLKRVGCLQGRASTLGLDRKRPSTLKVVASASRSHFRFLLSEFLLLSVLPTPISDLSVISAFQRLSSFPLRPLLFNFYFYQNGP